MTIIRLHGILAKKFGSVIKLHIGNLNQIISALDSIKTGFRKEINRISQEGGHYCIERDSDSVVHILPFLCGFKGGFLTILLIVAIVVIVVVITVVTLGTGGLAASTLLTGATAGGSFTALSVATFLAFQIALGVLISVLTYKEPKEATLKVEASVGGASGGTEAVGKSYTFSNLNNAEAQGVSIPLGYGKMRIGSRVINVSIKDYPTNYKFEDETSINQSQSVFANYLAF
jgi:predicted phage tail protein